jgi:hypothetical protein
MKKTALTLIIILSLTSNAHAIRFGNETTVYPDKVDHSNQVLESYNLQTGGTCHVYSAAILFEAACFRATGDRVNISELPLVKTHLYEQLSKYNRFGLNGNTDKNPYHLLSTNSVGKSIDGGYPINSLHRIFNDYPSAQKDPHEVVKLGTEIHTTIEHYDEQAQTVKDKYKKNETEQIKAVNSEYKKIIDSILSEKNKFESLKASISEQKTFKDILALQAKIDASKTKITKLTFEFFETYSGKTMQKTAVKAVNGALTLKEVEKIEKEALTSLREKILHFDENNEMGSGEEQAKINECWSHTMMYNSEDYTDKKALELLSKGIPFICTGVVKNGSKGFYGDAHATTVFGYEYDPSYFHSLNFKVKDSNFTKPSWGWELNCHTITWIKVRSNGEFPKQ